MKRGASVAAGDSDFGRRFARNKTTHREAIMKKIVIFTALASGLFMGTAHASSEVVINFVETSNQCGGTYFNYAQETADYFGNKLYYSYDFDQKTRRSNYNAEATAWGDSSLVSYGHDNHGGSPWHGVDDEDVALFYGHGTRSCSGGKFYSSILMGDDYANQCNHYLGKQVNSTRWGDDDLNIVILDTCQSMHKCVADNGGYWVGENRMMTIMGYHGISYDSLVHTWDFEDFVDQSRNDGIGDNFLDETVRTPSGANNDTCPAAFVYGATEADRSYIYQFGGLKDWKTITSHSKATYFYMKNCDPLDGATL